MEKERKNGILGHKRGTVLVNKQSPFLLFLIDETRNFHGKVIKNLKLVIDNQNKRAIIKSKVIDNQKRKETLI